MKVMNFDAIEKIRSKIKRLQDHAEYLESGGSPIMSELRRNALVAALERTGGNRTHAAIQLGISIRTLRNWCHKFGIKNDA